MSEYKHLQKYEWAMLDGAIASFFTDHAADPVGETDRLHEILLAHLEAIHDAVRIALAHNHETMDYEN